MNLLEKYNIQKVEIMCEKHGKQVVSSFDIGREHCIGKCVYCKEEDAVKRVNVELTRMRTETALGAIPSRFRVKSLNEFETSDQEARKEALRFVGGASRRAFQSYPSWMHWSWQDALTDLHGHGGPA